MSRRHNYTGMYSRHHRRTQNNIPQRSQTRCTIQNIKHIANLLSQYIWTTYSMINGNYLALATVFAVVLLSFLIPDISQKIHASNELQKMKKVLNKMTNEVNRAEVACLAAADEICHLQCSMQDGATETPKYLQDVSICTSRCVRPTVSEPVQFERKINLFKRIFYPGSNTSHKEIAIMSYVYTDSFNAENTMTNCNTLSE